MKENNIDEKLVIENEVMVENNDKATITNKPLPHENFMANKYYQRIMKRLRRIEVMACTAILLLLVVVFLMLINDFTGKKVIDNNSSKISNNQLTTQNKFMLPNGIDANTLDELITIIKQAYNSGDNTGLYNILGDEERKLITQDNFNTSMETFKGIGKMLEAKFKDYQYLKTEKGEKWFILNYTATYESGSGEAIVAIKASAVRWEVTGFKFNVANKNY